MSGQQPAWRPAWRTRFDSATGLTGEGAAWCFLTLLCVLIGVSVGVSLLPRLDHPHQNEPGFFNALGNWDGVWYARIARDGYSVDPQGQSTIAFFPAFPLAGAAVSRLTGLSVEHALLIVNSAALVGLFCAMLAYVRARYPDQPPELADWTVLAMGLWPVSFFLRAAYTESLFLLISVLTLYGARRRWPVATIALLAGLATACRSVGVALAPIVAVEIWCRRTSWQGAVLHCAWLLPLSVWGLLAFMAYQQAAFGDPFAFAAAQEHWAARPNVPLSERLWAALTLENIWSKYDSTSRAWWAYKEPDVNPLFSLEFANPIYFLLVCSLIAYGAWRRWLNLPECLLAAGLLLIPYVSQGHRTVMQSQARFATAVFPLYLVLGRILARLPAPVAALLLAVSALMLGIYAALFAAWHRFF